MGHQEIRIVILHRNRLFRESLALILAEQEAISVIFTAAGFDQTDGELTSLRPDLFLLDFGMPGRGGVDDARQIRAIYSECKVLMIDVPDREADVLACIEVGGAAGYLLQDASVENLVSNIMAVVAGEALCTPRIASLAFSRISALARQTTELSPGNVTHLTRRELEIIALIEDGLSNKEIATRLHIEVPTVKNHVHNILEKLQLDDRREAARYVKEHRLTMSWH
ncbi:hypothetical protein AYO43_00580 [Nitrospira sp. SCGC AG-212-E16]|nr:hypothetical protein AYO43_00580 [Nitrospira sp. SCGC AG-212-E16]